MATDINILIKATDQASPAIKKVEGGLKEMSSSAKSSSSALSSLGSVVKTGLTTALIGVGAALAGTAVFMKGSIDAAKESIQANKQLEQVIKSTGGAAGVTADQARDLASSLSLVTNFGDDAIVSGENLLLTFTGIGKDVFPRATEAMLDMSQALGQDMSSSAVQLGKALNDPINGMTALSRVGVSFTDQQKEMITTMQNANDIAGAQTVILDELAKEFGGSAKALADPATQLANAWGEVQEAVGMGLMPILTELAQTVLPYVQAAAVATSDAFNAFYTYLAEGNTVLDSIKFAIADVLPADSKQKWLDFAGDIQGTLNTMVGNVQNAMGWIKLAWDTNWGDIRETWETFATELPEKQKEFWDNWHAIFDDGSKQNVNDWEEFLGNLFGGITRWAGFVMDLLNGFLGNWRRTTTAWHALTIGDWSTFWTNIGGNFTTAFDLLLSFVDIFNKGFKDKIVGGLQGAWDGLKSLWTDFAAWWGNTWGALIGISTPTITPNFAIVNPANTGSNRPSSTNYTINQTFGGQADATTVSDATETGVLRAQRSLGLR